MPLAERLAGEQARDQRGTSSATRKQDARARRCRIGASFFDVRCVFVVERVFLSASAVLRSRPGVVGLAPSRLVGRRRRSCPTPSCLAWRVDLALRRAAADRRCWSARRRGRAPAGTLRLARVADRRPARRTNSTISTTRSMTIAMMRERCGATMPGKLDRRRRQLDRRLRGRGSTTRRRAGASAWASTVGLRVGAAHRTASSSSYVVVIVVAAVRPARAARRSGRAGTDRTGRSTPCSSAAASALASPSVAERGLLARGTRRGCRRRGASASTPSSS